MSNEHIWHGSFGTDYTRRNDLDFSARNGWWDYISDKHHFGSVLEIGCNNGMNLASLARNLDHPSMAWGVDVNEEAVAACKRKHPKLNVVLASGLDLPFRDGCFDMVFTAGVLIHQSPSTFEMMMQEIIRVSNKYVMAIEYDAEVFTEVPYRGLQGALFKGPFGEVYERKYGLKLLYKEKVGKEWGFDDAMVWVLSKT